MQRELGLCWVVARWRGSRKGEGVREHEDALVFGLGDGDGDGAQMVLERNWYH